MNPEQSQDPFRASSQPQTPVIPFNSSYAHTYTQPSFTQTQFLAGFYGPVTLSPILHSQTPEPDWPDTAQALHSMAMAPAHPYLIQSMHQQAQVLPQVVSPKAEEALKVNPKAQTKKTGKGSRSGRNACTSGISDTDVDEKVKNEGKLVVSGATKAKWDKGTTLKLVEFVCSPENWNKVSNSLSKIMLKASQVVFDNQYTLAQCTTKWNIIFRLYKETRRFLNHTGRGDGNVDPDDDDLITVDINECTGSDIEGNKEEVKKEEKGEKKPKKKRKQAGM
ncbi:uncharacterized protein FOMMEDRAFT_151148 [Fomitiporia mediterranea MF3/22]|uniref:uncharacterized protein n=1 Tax=Fomitiporia mediterranea (strain MF3/22) TaxID=694068 RepID=UPI0004409843|nr:uncharacterized protein FOMMEDRAFT_151148 [Fomitiporia mediterranea MF3/22]EJD08358.1 hypothetical protein FOMMEDRAFT_151148 [Fomitiporia mediterranea MF3/22]